MWCRGRWKGHDVMVSMTAASWDMRGRGRDVINFAWSVLWHEESWIEYASFDMYERSEVCLWRGCAGIRGRAGLRSVKAR